MGGAILMSHNVQDETTIFHLQLLSKIIDMEQYPLTKLIIENNITQLEFEGIITLLEDLDKQFRAQKEEGFMDFTGLLVHFAGMLSEKLNPTKTICALKKEGCYPSLMAEFIKILNETKG